MNRRELLRLIAAATGTAMIGSAGLISGCATKIPADFSAANIALLDEIAETILPRTDTPGAKDAKVGEFMSLYVTDCYSLDERATFHKDLFTLEASCSKTYGRSFMALDPAERETFINQLDRQARVAVAAGKTHYFTMLKQLTLFGFFTSEVGGTIALRYLPVPGRYDGELPYQPGDRAWATN
jgi:hypothetical protein